MWGPLYLTCLALAGALTWGFAIRERAIVFSAAMATVLWSYLALVAEVSVASNGTTVGLSVGAIRWVWTAFALLSMIALIGAILGIYPDTTPEQQFTEVS